MTPSHAWQADDEGLPSAEDLLDKHVVATGGKQAHLALTSRKKWGKLEVKMAGHEFVASVEEQSLAPGKSHISIDGDFFFQVNVCNGEHAWEWRPAHSHGDQGAGGDSGVTTLLKGVKAARAIEKADFHAAVHWRKRFASLKTLGVVDVNGAPAYEVRLTTKSDEQYSQFYDKSNGRMVKRTRTSPSVMGEVDMEVFFEDYGEFDGVWMPTTVRALLNSPTMGKGTQTWTYSRIEHDKKISPSLFEMPEELRDHGHEEHGAEQGHDVSGIGERTD